METINSWILKQYAAMQTIARDEEGQDFAEYALIFALCVIVAAAAFGPLGTAIAGAVGAVTAQL